MGYLCLNENINAINLAKETANINDSNTDIGITPGPHDVGHVVLATGYCVLRLPSMSVPTTLEYLFYYLSIIPHTSSTNILYSTKILHVFPTLPAIL